MPPTFRSGRPDPYLRLHGITLFVRDQERSLRFYVDQLKFQLVVDAMIDDGQRWIAVAPPDGPSVLALIQPKPGSREVDLIGKSVAVALACEDVQAKYDEWSARGVRFHYPPYRTVWGGIMTIFEDIDGNSFALVSYDAVIREVEDRRHAAEEVAIAREVQSRLFPQSRPLLRTLDYAGACLQARAVGGDYYDFLNLGHDRLGLVVGDISGKGMAAALLMAHLQATLRSQCAIASDQPERFLRSVNQLFYENTRESAFATLFFAVYDDTARRLRYINCGHWPALLFRAGGALEALPSTCTVLGVFADWSCAVDERSLAPGDTLVIYTDGITEASNAAGADFGEQRPIDAVLQRRAQDPQSLVASVVDEVLRFAAQEQNDDITLIVARCCG